MSEHPRSSEHDPKLPHPASLHESRAGRRSVDSGRTLLVGILGGIATSVGYAVYQRLPEEQRDRLNDQARGFLSSRLNEFRSNLNL